MIVPELNLGEQIGGQDTVEYPLRSPDLTHLDFFMWGYLKVEKFSSCKNAAKIPIEILTVASDSNVSHCQQYLHHNGYQFENIIR